MRTSINRLRRTSLICVCLVPTLTMAQQSDNNRERPSRQSTIDATEQSERTLSPSEFAYEAAWISLKEMRLGNIAIQKTTDSEIRQFAQKLVTDHAGANNRLTQLARNKGYQLPNTNLFERIGSGSNPDRSSDDRSSNRQQSEGSRSGGGGYQGQMAEHQNDLRELRRIQGLSGVEFDRAFLNEVVESHEVAVSTFEHATETVMDEQVKQFAKDALPILEDHLNRAQQLVSSKGWDVGGGLGGTTVTSPANFAYGAVLMSLKEIRVSEMALRKTSDSSVREYAQQMISAHSGMNNRLLQLSRNKGYEVPSTNLFANLRGQRGGDGEKPRQGSGARKQTEGTRPESDFDSDRDNPNGTAQASKNGTMDSSDLEQIRQKELQSLRRLQGLSGDRFDRAYITEMVRDHTRAIRKFQSASENIADEQVKLFAKDSLPILQDHLNHAQRLAREKGVNVGRGFGAVEIR